MGNDVCRLYLGLREVRKQVLGGSISEFQWKDCGGNLAPKPLSMHCAISRLRQSACDDGGRLCGIGRAIMRRKREECVLVCHCKVAPRGTLMKDGAPDAPSAAALPLEGQTE
jgi:hypothetical protein